MLEVISSTEAETETSSEEVAPPSRSVSKVSSQEERSGKTGPLLQTEEQETGVEQTLYRKQICTYRLQY